MAALKDPVGYLAEHYVYEIDMLRHTAYRLLSEPEGNDRNALIEAFALHARVLLDFYGPGKWDDDVVADNFTQPGAFQAVTTGLDSAIRDRINKKIQHLTAAREDKPKFGEDDIPLLLTAISADHEAFKRAVRPKFAGCFRG